MPRIQIAFQTDTELRALFNEFCAMRQVTYAQLMNNFIRYLVENKNHAQDIEIIIENSRMKESFILAKKKAQEDMESARAKLQKMRRKAEIREELHEKDVKKLARQIKSKARAKQKLQEDQERTALKFSAEEVLDALARQKV